LWSPLPLTGEKADSSIKVSQPKEKAVYYGDPHKIKNRNKKQKIKLPIPTNIQIATQITINMKRTRHYDFSKP
jgi:hypothetical protein